MPTEPPLTYYISYGFLCGPAHGRRLNKLLAAQGYHATSDPGTADILIAHSAGCLSLPKPENMNARLILLIGPPLGHADRFRTFLRAQRGNIYCFAKNRHPGTWLHFMASCLWYGLSQPKRNLAIATDIEHLQLDETFTGQVVFIANCYDPWPRSEQLARMLDDKSWSFVALKGSHDNFWEEPAIYAAIINQYAARLLAQADR